jgi:DNA-binding SARP family transcriptional activator
MYTPYPTRQLGREILVAVGHLLWTSALVVGAPIVLVRFFGWPLPTTLPSFGEVIATPLQLIDPVVILNGFVCLAWICWGITAIYLLLDLVDLARGVGQRLHRVGPFSTVAAKLVSSVVLLLSLARPTVALAAPTSMTPMVQVLETTSPDPQTWSLDPGGEALPAAGPPDVASADPAAIPTPSAPVYVVERGDSLWAIAEDHLGSGFRWTEIRDLNRDLIADPDIICIGWELRLPSDGGLPVDPPVDDPAPAAAVPTQAIPLAAITELMPSPQVPSPPETPMLTTDAHTTADQAQPQTAPEAEGILPSLAQHVAGISGATVLASGLLLALRHRRRRHGRPVPRHDASPIERTVVAASDVPLIRWVGQELAILGELIAGRRYPAIPIAVEFSEETGIELLWDRPFPDAPAPWEAVPGGWAWRTVYDPDAPVPAAERPSLVPGLVTIGSRDGRQLMINLEALGSLAVTGDPDSVHGLIRSIVVELGTCDEIADAHVSVTPGLAGVSTAAENFPRLETVSLDDAMDQVRSASRGAEHALDGLDADSTFGYRIHSTPVLPFELTVVVVSGTDPVSASALVDGVQPNMGVAVLVAGDLDGTAHQITIGADGSARLEPLGVTFVPNVLFPDAEAAVSVMLDDAPVASPCESVDRDALAVRPWWLDAPDTGGSEAEQVGDDLDDLVEQWGDLVRSDWDAEGEGPVIVADLTDRCADGVDADRLPEPRLRIKVLGTPRIVDGPPLGRRELAITVFVACATRPVSHEHIQDAIWGGDAISTKRVFNLIGAARTALGSWDGEPVLTAALRPHHTIDLQDGVRTDLADFRRLVALAEESPSPMALSLLEEALEMVEGPPFDAPGYDWANTSQLVSEAENLIERAASFAVDLALDAGDVDRARWAVMQGLRGLPGDELLYRARMRIEDAAGNPTAVRRAYDELLTYLEDFGAEPSSETTTFLQAHSWSSRKS